MTNVTGNAQAGAGTFTAPAPGATGGGGGSGAEAPPAGGGPNAPPFAVLGSSNGMLYDVGPFPGAGGILGVGQAQGLNTAANSSIAHPPTASAAGTHNGVSLTAEQGDQDAQGLTAMASGLSIAVEESEWEDESGEEDEEDEDLEESEVH